MSFLNHFYDFFLPRFCVACDIKLENSEKYFCRECFADIRVADPDLIENEYQRKFHRTNVIKEFNSLFVFEKDKALQHAIHSIKYNENFKLGIFLGFHTAQKLYNEIKKWNAELLIPVPLYHLKKAERGYNQSYFIAKGISNATKIPVNQKIIKRIRHTPSQTELNLQERRNNMDRAFTVSNSKILINKNVIIVDDVITTGSTVGECGKIIYDAGAANVYALSVALADL